VHLIRWCGLMRCILRRIYKRLNPDRGKVAVLDGASFGIAS
jgi:hypothetical protein